MKKLFLKSELWFFLLWMFIYIFSQQLGLALSRLLGAQWLIKAPINLFLSLFLLFWIRKENLRDYFCLGRLRADPRDLLYFIPLILLSTSNLWRGVSVTLPLGELISCIITMACVGFLEEILLRGFLFQVLRKDSLRLAVIVSTLSFSAGHILNLFSGRGVSLGDNLLQLFYAFCIGFLYALVLIRSGSLWPCIFSHAAIDVLSVFAVREGLTASRRIPLMGLELLITGFYILFLIRKPKVK